MFTWDQIKPDVSRSTINKRDQQMRTIEDIAEVSITDLVKNNQKIKNLVLKLEKCYKPSTVHAYLSCLLGVWNRYGDGSSEIFTLLNQKLEKNHVTNSDVQPVKVEGELKEKLFAAMQDSSNKGKIGRIAQLIYFPETRGLRPSTYLHTIVDWDGNKKDEKKFNFMDIPRKTYTIHKKLKNYKVNRVIKLSDEFIEWLPKTGFKLEHLVYMKRGGKFKSVTALTNCIKKHFNVSFGQIRKGACQEDYDRNVPLEKMKQNAHRLGHSVGMHARQYINLKQYIKLDTPKPIFKLKKALKKITVIKRKISK